MKKTVKIKIKYFDEELEKIQKIQVGEWLDLRAREDVTIEEGEFGLIPLGIAMELPKGYEAHIVPRSSTFKNWGVIQTNSMGVVDNSYCGDNDEWMMPVFCLQGKSKWDDVGVITDGWKSTKTKNYTRIAKGDRICQFRIVPIQPKIKFLEVEKLENKNRGGFGTTGK